MKPIECVLLIDDNKATNFLHQDLIAETALAKKVVVRTNGKTGMEYLQNPAECVPELILVDVHMPVMDGFEFIASYQAARQGPSAVIVKT